MPQVLRWIKLVGAGVAVAVAVALAADLFRAAAPRPRPNFTGTTLQGERWSLADHRGRRPVLISFFATWCSPCRQEFPHLVRLQREYADRGLVVAVLTEEPPEIIRADPSLAGAPVIFLTGASEIFALYGINAIPVTIYFEPGGDPKRQAEGYDEEMLKAVAAELERLPRKEPGEITPGG